MICSGVACGCGNIKSSPTICIFPGYDSKSLKIITSSHDIWRHILSRARKLYLTTKKQESCTFSLSNIFFTQKPKNCMMWKCIKIAQYGTSEGQKLFSKFPLFYISGTRKYVLSPLWLNSSSTKQYIALALLQVVVYVVFHKIPWFHKC